MNRIISPDLKIGEFYDTITSNIIKKKNGNPLKPIYLNIITTLSLAEEEYINLANRQRLSQVKKNLLPCLDLEINDMRFLYDKFKNEGRDYYTKIKGLPFLKRCPYCEKRDVSELDHYLSQSIFPMHVITPVNLIPSCHECNNNKLASEMEIIQPYFDDTTQEQWLFCELKFEHERIIPEYIISFKETSYNKNFQNKIINTFNCLKLQDDYATWASSLINNKNKYWKDLYKEGGTAFIIYLLNKERDSINPRLESKNSYQVVLLNSLIEFFATPSKYFEKN